jgi:hypothetical protein
VRTLIDYIEGGDSLDEFLEQYPTVSRKQAVAPEIQRHAGWVSSPPRA